MSIRKKQLTKGLWDLFVKFYNLSQRPTNSRRTIHHVAGGFISGGGFVIATAVADVVSFISFSFLPPSCSSCSIISRHKALEGSSQASVEYQALQLVSSMEHYGVEWHWARDANGQRMAIGVGPEGIAVCKDDFTLVNR